MSCPILSLPEEVGASRRPFCCRCSTKLWFAIHRERHHVPQSAARPSRLWPTRDSPSTATATTEGTASQSVNQSVIQTGSQSDSQAVQQHFHFQTKTRNEKGKKRKEGRKKSLAVLRSRRSMSGSADHSGSSRSPRHSRGERAKLAEDPDDTSSRGCNTTGAEANFSLTSTQAPRGSFAVVRAAPPPGTN